MTQNTQIIGPFKQIVTMQGLSLMGHIADEALEVFDEAGVFVVDGVIELVAPWSEVKKIKAKDKTILEHDYVLMPGLIDVHTHLCFAGSRARDHALRMAGASYLEIAKQGGGILDTVKKTRDASPEELSQNLVKNCDRILKNGVTTCEVKSGYGLTVASELKMLEVINDVNNTHAIDLVPTCLAAHTLPPEFDDHKKYLEHVVTELLPKIQNRSGKISGGGLPRSARNDGLGSGKISGGGLPRSARNDWLAKRIDIFVEESAFNTEDARWYLTKAKELGFDVVVHADQFSPGGSKVASEVGAIAAEHLEASSDLELDLLAKNQVAAVVLPGCSLGLGLNFAPAKKILEKNLCLVIASDYNPGSAPMGDLLTGAALLGVYEKLSTAEVFAGITYRAAHVLGLKDRGQLVKGMQADMIAFACEDYKEILYHQGQLKPGYVWKKGKSLPLM